MFQKKKQIIQVILVIGAVLACAGVLSHSAPNGRLSSLQVSEAEYQTILDSHTRSDRELLGGLRMNEYSAVFDRGSDTFYYSMIEGDADRFDPIITADRDVKLAVLSDPIDETFVKRNGTVRILAYNKTLCREYQLKLTTLPVLNIVTEKEITGNVPVTFTMVFFDNRAEAPLRFSSSIGTIHLRGGSSKMYPKISYKIKLKSSVGKTEARDANLLGLRENSEWILYAPYADRDCVRSVFTTKLWKESCARQNEFGVDNGYEFRYVEVFLNGTYHGLFALGYMPDELQIRINEADGEVLYKNQEWFDEETDLNELDEHFSIVDGFDGFSAYASDARWQPLKDYIALLQADASLKEIWNHVDRDTFENMYLFTNVTQGYDCARDTHAKNFYISAKKSNGSYKMLYTPWDLDITWVKYFADYVMDVDSNYLFPFGPFRRNVPEEDPELFNELCKRYHNLRSDAWSDESIIELLSMYEAQIFGSGAYSRDKECWPESDLEEGRTDLAEFKNYVIQRMAYCDQYYQ